MSDTLPRVRDARHGATDADRAGTGYTHPEAAHVIVTQRVVAADADAYSGGIPGIQLDVVRTGIGGGPNRVDSVEAEDCVFAVGSVGFPVRGHTQVGDDVIIAAHIDAAPPGTRWCGIDVVPGNVLLYGPGAEHTGVSPAGVRYSLSAVSVDAVRTMADESERRVELPEDGTVQLLGATPGARELARQLSRLEGTLAVESVRPSLRSTELSALLCALAVNHTETSRRDAESRRIVGACVEYADDVDYVPSISELSCAAYASERRVRYAFEDMFGLPPSLFFRERLLSRVRDRLVRADPDSMTVTRMLSEFGVKHFGRFAQQYASVWGEPPSETLRSAHVQ